jgi:6-pyruvoyltetrahydropterin/6-carboxytetrahydropterin synthase
MKITVHRKAHFNAAHRLFNKSWSDEKNLEIFGKCSNPNYHGHNYELVVSVTGDIDQETGMVINLKTLQKIIHDKIEEEFDHKNLNLDVTYFQDKIPTAENIVVVIWEILRKEISGHLDLEVTLYETPRNFVTYTG